MPFKKGDKNINRKGRLDGGLSITTLVKRKLAQQAERPRGSKIEKNATNADLIIDKIFDMALNKSDPHMLKMIWNYIDGLPKQDIGLTGANNKPIPFLNLSINVNKDKTKVKAKNEGAKIIEGEVKKKD